MFHTDHLTLAALYLENAPFGPASAGMWAHGARSWLAIGAPLLASTLPRAMPVFPN